MMKLSWIGSLILLFLGQWVNGFVLYNEAEQSFLDSRGVAGATAANKSSSVLLTLIQGAAAKGAVCLDGTLPGYHLDPGHGSGAHNWLIQLEGGGWCNNIRSCVFRKTSPRGSSTFMEKEIAFTGILSKYPSENPDFYSWNRVKLRYCDGASFLGDGKIKRSQLQFRGQRIWLAAMDELMSRGMRFAKQALLSGCSAGGLASIMHCDEFRGLFPPTTRVKCLSDAGLFLDAADVSGNHYIRGFFGNVVTLQHAQKNLPAACTNHLDPTSCFFPQNVIAGIQTPLFLLNSAYDIWQIVESLTRPSADPHGYWKYCRYNQSACSPSQIQFLQQFRHQMLNAIEDFSKSAKNGLFINSCFAHCQSENQEAWFSQGSPSIGKKAIAVAVGDWFFERAAVKAIDCPYPCDKTCNHFASRRKTSLPQFG